MHFRGWPDAFTGLAKGQGGFVHFIQYFYDAVRADEAVELLEGNGIPVFLGNGEGAGVYRAALFVLFEEQILDARKLLRDESHVVEKTVDMDDYYEFSENFDGSGAIVKYSLYVLAAVVALLALLITLAGLI